MLENWILLHFDSNANIGVECSRVINLYLNILIIDYSPIFFCPKLAPDTVRRSNAY